MRDTWARVRELLVGLAVLGSVTGLAACDEPADPSAIPPVTAPPSQPTPDSSHSPDPPVPDLPTSPACSLLTTEEVVEALGGSTVQQPFGTEVATTGASGLPIYLDMCSWQVPDVSPARTVQVETNTAGSPEDAATEFEEILAATIAHTAPGATAEYLDGLGSRAAQIPEWIFVLNNNVVLVVTVSPTSSGPPDSTVLERLARSAAARLGW
jgi:hypothetical protein